MIIITFTCAICVRAYVPPVVRCSPCCIDAANMTVEQIFGFRDRKDYCAAAWN